MGGPDVPADGVDEAAAERARTLETIIQAGMAVLALGAFSALFRAGPVLDTAFPYLSMLAGHALALVIARTGRQRLAVSVHVALYLGVVGMVMVRYGGIRSPAGFVLPPIVMVAGLTWNGRAALATAGAAALLTVAMVVLERRGVLPPASAPPPDRLAVVTVGTLLITGAILAVALRAIETATHRALQHERARHRLEERLTDARRLETVARVAAGVAHDFNNMLMVIHGMASSLRTSADPLAASAATAIEEAAGRATKLAGLLLAFGRRQPLELRTVDVNTVVRDAEKLIRSFASESKLALDLAEDAFVRADPTQLQQVLCNLVGNAADAMPTPGTVTLRVATASADDLARAPEWNAGPLGAVAIAVHDTGTGLTPEVRARLFEPFFTTKKPGKGTGLGLASVHGIVTQSGGTIAVESEPGSTTFTVLLSRVERVTPNPSRPAEKGSA